jgi:hypothetical protein
MYLYVKDKSRFDLLGGNHNTLTANMLYRADHLFNYYTPRRGEKSASIFPHGCGEAIKPLGGSSTAWKFRWKVRLIASHSVAPSSSLRGAGGGFDEGGDIGFKLREGGGEGVELVAGGVAGEGNIIT